MNVFTFSGRIGRDAETGSTTSGSTVCNFPVAVESGYGDKKQTTWVRCAIWGKRAEGGLPQYLKKGAQVVVSGELSTREFKKKEGDNGFSVEIRVAELTLVGGQANGQQQNSYQQPAPQQQAQPAGNFDNSFDDDIPF